MSKLYNKYLELKKEDENKLYLFPCGNFYIFLSDDAYKINEYVVLKITHFANNVEKCGFPKNRLEDYLKVFKNQNLDILIVDDLEADKTNLDKILHILDNIDINNMTPLEAFQTLIKLKEVQNGRSYN